MYIEHIYNVEPKIWGASAHKAPLVSIPLSSCPFENSDVREHGKQWLKANDGRTNEVFPAKSAPYAYLLNTTKNHAITINTMQHCLPV